MEKIRNNETIINKQKPEFSREVPDKHDIEQLAKQVSINRELISLRANEFGLSPDFIKQNTRIAVGPFVSPAPLSTTFAGQIENLNCSIKVGNEIVNQLKQNGIRAQQFMLINLAMTDMPKKGAGAMDCLIIPKNKSSNQRLSLIDKNAEAKVYGKTNTSRDHINSLVKPITTSYHQYAEQYPQLKRNGQGKILPAAIFEDLTLAMQDAQSDEPDNLNVHYLNFSSKLNTRILNRILPENNLTITNVDTQYYSPFLKKGIKDVGQFTRKLESIGFFDSNPGYIKFVAENGKSQILQLADITQNDAILTSKGSNEQIRFSDLQKSDADLAPCKELTYILCMTNIAPVIYGSINNGYYEPYAIAKEQTEKLGFTPNIYRIQPEIPDGYENIATVFDFYKPLVLNETK
jgi:hypothetical protein